MPTVIQGPKCNRRVTCSPPSDPQFLAGNRSESALIINPKDPYHLVGASKKFTNRLTYAFSLAAYYSFDGGQSWNESPPLGLLYDWTGVSDPTLTFDSLGNVFLLGLPFGNNGPYDLRGMVAYKSTDGGKTWSAPNHIHNVFGDDKQWIAADTNPLSPYYGNVYACWDSGNIGTSNLCFTKTSDHGTSWTNNLINGIPGIFDSGSPELNVGRDGTIYIVWWNGGNAIEFTKSTDGGNSFSAKQPVASGITHIPSNFPGAKFRLGSWATACCGSGQNFIVAWADYRTGVSRIYFNQSTDGGASWQYPTMGTPGAPLLGGALASGSGQHDFHPQLASTPKGEIGCAFYEYGSQGSGEFFSNLIDVYLAVSTDNGKTFTNRCKVTDQAWDPTVNEVWAHGDPNITFIGEYFGFDASRLGFFPFWTDTRTGTQEMFVSRIAVNPADVMIRDSSTDTGAVPSPGDHWEYVDLIVRRQPDGDTTFVNEKLLRDGVTDHYIYARVKNNGPNTAVNVKLSAMIGNYPSLQSLPGLEFRYPQDWYANDWNTMALQGNHLDLGQSSPAIINNGATKIIGPVIWPADQIPDPATWHHPCLLAEILTDNDDAAGTFPNSDPVPAEGDKNACNYGSYFWGHNNVTQRNLSYAPVSSNGLTALSFSFIAGNLLSPSKFMEIIVDKGKELAKIPMTLIREPILIRQSSALPEDKKCPCGEIVFLEKSKVVVKSGECNVGEIIVVPGTIWKCPCKDAKVIQPGTVSYEVQPKDQSWKLGKQSNTVGFSIPKGALYKMTLSFELPAKFKFNKNTAVRIFQRNNKKVITGGVILKFEKR